MTENLGILDYEQEKSRMNLAEAKRIKSELSSPVTEQFSYNIDAKSMKGVPEKIIEALNSLHDGIHLSELLLEYYLKSANPSRMSASQGELSLLDSSGGRALLVRFQDSTVQEVIISLGSYSRGINLPWQDFIKKYPNSKFENFVRSLEIPREANTTEPIGFSYRQWRDESGADHANITLKESLRPAFDTQPFFPFHDTQKVPQNPFIK